MSDSLISARRNQYKWTEGTGSYWLKIKTCLHLYLFVYPRRLCSKCSYVSSHCCCTFFQMKVCMDEFRSLAARYADLHQSSFDADYATLRNVELYPYTCLSNIPLGRLFWPFFSSIMSSSFNVSHLFFLYEKVFF